MNRDGLIKEVSKRVGASPLIVRAVIGEFESVVIDTVGAGQRLKLSRFGCFEGLESRSRRIALFGTEKSATLPARMKLKFRQSKVTGRRLRSAALASRRG